MNHEFHCGDMLEALSGMDQDSVDLVFTSPPYEDARTYGIGFRMKGDEWVQWAADRFCECIRVCCGMVGVLMIGASSLMSSREDAIYFTVRGVGLIAMFLFAVCDPE